MLPMTFAPTLAADLAATGQDRLGFRIRAVTARVGDKIVGIGGLSFLDDGTVLAFCHLTDAARRRKVALHKAALAALARAKASGIRRIVATADPEQPAAERWLERLGFVSALALGIEPIHINGHTVFIRQDR